MQSRSGSTRPRVARARRAAARQSATSTTPHWPRSSSRYGAAVARRAAVVDVDHREAAAGPVLHADGEHRQRLRRRAAVDHHEQRRPLARRALEPGVGRRVEQRVAGARLAGAVDGREPRRAPAREISPGSSAQVARRRAGCRPRGVAPDRSMRCTPGSAVGLPATTTTASGPAATTAPTVVKGRSRSVSAPSGPRTRQAVEPVAPARHDHLSVVEHRVAGRAERPRGHADVGVGADHGLDVVAGLPAVEVPPVGAVGEEPQRAVGAPPRLGDRLARPARDDRLLAGGEVADDQLGGVPRHRRVVPLQPGQRGAVRATAAVPRRSPGR